MIETVGVAIALGLVGFRLRPRPPARRADATTSSIDDAGTAPSDGRLREAARLVGPVGRWRMGRRTSIEADAVAAWCTALARAVRSGSTLAGAIRTIAPPASCAHHLAPVTLALERGRPLADALVVPTSSAHLTLALGVLQACAGHGGPPAEPLDRAAATLRARAAAAAERRTQSAQARLSAVVMTVLPVAMLGLLLVTSSATRTSVASPIGAMVVTTGLTLNLVGWRWMRRIIAKGAS